MNDLKWLLISLTLLTCLPLISQSLQSNADILIIEAGENTSLAGAIHRNQEIIIAAGSTLTVIADDGTPEHDGSINLIAPYIRVDGTIIASAAGYNTIGAGIGSTVTANGGGGGGYGGEGGKGEGVYGGAGGNVYGTGFSEETGSYGYLAGILESRSGYGGGLIRVDAISLTVGANAVLDARANMTPYNATGGGSGGCIYINALYTMLEGNSQLNVSGGPGGMASGSAGAAGGGGGGRVKLIKHPLGFNNNSTITRFGGESGGGTAQSGIQGIDQEISAPSPDFPTLISPSDGQLVDRSPTFTFSATDPTNSKFLKYQVIMSLDDSFTSLTFTASQLDDPTNWTKPYYASGETAAFTLSDELVGGTTYYWRVSVTSNNGATWVNSGYRSFTALTNQPPEVPVLLEPSNDQVQVNALPAFQVLGADFEGDDLVFRLTLSRSSDLSNPQFFTETYPGWDQSIYIPSGSYAGVTATCQLQVDDALVPNTDYFWKVTCLDQPYGLQQESGIYRFTTTRIVPQAPILILPADQYQVPNNQVNFKFQVATSLGNTLAGRVEISEDNFATILYTFDQQQNQTGWSQSFYPSGSTASLTLPEPTALEENKTYYWRAYAFDGPYSGPVSVVRRFRLANQLQFQMIRVLPNPARSVESMQFFVRLTVDAKITILIYNKLGKQIDQIHVQGAGGVDGNYIHYEISDYATGIYFYTIEAESAYGLKKETKKFAVIN